MEISKSNIGESPALNDNMTSSFNSNMDNIGDGGTKSNPEASFRDDKKTVSRSSSESSTERLIMDLLEEDSYSTDPE